MKVWETGDDYGRMSVLLFIHDHGPPGGDEIVWSSLRSENVHVVAGGLAVAVGRVLRKRAQPGAGAVSDLVRIVRDDPIDIQRFMALHVLTLAKVEGLDSWLQELAEGIDPRDPSAKRTRALMRKGHAGAKAALFEDLREHPGNFGVADDLWQHRRALEPDQRMRSDELRGAVLRYIESLRRWIRDPDDRHMSVGMLGSYIRDGFPFEDDDIEAVGRFAVCASDIADRVDAVDTLAAFDAPRAWQWVEELASSEQPKEVVDRARRVLRKRHRSPT